MSTQLNIHNTMPLSGTYTIPDQAEAEAIRDALTDIAARLDKARGYPIALNIDVWPAAGGSIVVARPPARA